MTGSDFHRIKEFSGLPQKLRQKVTVWGNRKGLPYPLIMPQILGQIWSLAEKDIHKFSRELLVFSRGLLGVG